MLNTVFLITGAGKGIGKSIALELAQRKGKISPKLFLVSRTEESLAQIEKECRTLGVKEIRTLATDMALPGQAKRIVAECLKAYRQIDCLINNAGVGRFGDFESLTEEDFDFVVGTNLKGTFLLTQAVFTSMKEKQTGHIFFVTSVAAEKPFEQSAIYCLSKFGQKGFLEVLRLYGYKNNIRITNVMPGATHTPMWGDVPETLSSKMMKPEDIAGLVVDAYLLPDRASVEEIVIRPIKGDI